jgi:hypothetical protein
MMLEKTSVSELPAGPNYLSDVGCSGHMKVLLRLDDFCEMHTRNFRFPSGSGLVCSILMWINFLLVPG